MSANILVVEDNIVNQKVIRWFLESIGHACDVVPDGAASLQAITENSYSLVLMDLHLPNIDGCTTAKLMRQSGFTVPIIALTAEDMPAGFQKCLDAGMNGYLTKPFIMEDFQVVLKRWLPSNQCEVD
jgi:two-component system, sensor histidine kinase and response regulator